MSEPAKKWVIAEFFGASEDNDSDGASYDVQAVPLIWCVGKTGRILYPQHLLMKQKKLKAAIRNCMAPDENFAECTTRYISSFILDDYEIAKNLEIAAENCSDTDMGVFMSNCLERLASEKRIPIPKSLVLPGEVSSDSEVPADRDDFLREPPLMVECPQQQALVILKSTHCQPRANQQVYKRKQQHPKALNKNEQPTTEKQHQQPTTQKQLLPTTQKKQPLPTTQKKQPLPTTQKKQPLPTTLKQQQPKTQQTTAGPSNPAKLSTGDKSSQPTKDGDFTFRINDEADSSTNNILSTILNAIKTSYSELSSRLESLEEKVNNIELKLDNVTSAVKHSHVQGSPPQEEATHANAFEFPLVTKAQLLELQEELKSNASFKAWFVTYLKDRSTLFPPITKMKKDIDAAQAFAVRCMMKAVMSNALAVHFNVRGNNKRRPGEEPKTGISIACPNIIAAILSALKEKLNMSNGPATDRITVERAIGAWLKQAYQRTEEAKLKRRKTNIASNEYIVPLDEISDLLVEEENELNEI